MKCLDVKKRSCTQSFTRVINDITSAFQLGGRERKRDISPGRVFPIKTETKKINRAYLRRVEVQNGTGKVERGKK